MVQWCANSVGRRSCVQSNSRKWQNTVEHEHWAFGAINWNDIFPRGKVFNFECAQRNIFEIFHLPQHQHRECHSKENPQIKLKVKHKLYVACVVFSALAYTLFYCCHTDSACSISASSIVHFISPAKVYISIQLEWFHWNTFILTKLWVDTKAHERSTSPIAPNTDDYIEEFTLRFGVCDNLFEKWREWQTQRSSNAKSWCHLWKKYLAKTDETMNEM